MTAFLWRSLFRAYGWRFLWHVALPHPLRTLRAVTVAGRLSCEGDSVDVPGPMRNGGPLRLLVGAGFCLKPLECPSGRFNHDCACLEGVATACCGACEIRRQGARALGEGAAFYIMTSASDILHDVYLPALRERRFTDGHFFLCRYSLRPFAAGMLAAGLRGRLVAFESGDCRDYRTWVRADVGLKEEQTGLPQAARAGGVADERRVEVRAEKRGSVYLSRYEGTLNVQRSMLNSQGVQNFSVES